MTSLQTHIPIEYIKKSEKLQEINTQDYYQSDGLKPTLNQHPPFTKEVYILQEGGGEYPAPTIADIIDNAEELFGSEDIMGNILLTMCQQNKTIEEISQYILDNIKEN